MAELSSALSEAAPIELPENFEHGELFWWQENARIHTLFTLWSDPLVVESGASEFWLTFSLFDRTGRLQVEWQQTMRAGETVFLNSTTCPATQTLNLSEGVLALAISTKTEPPRQIKPPSLYSMIDWFSEEGELVSLHNGQLIGPSAYPLEWTEIVLQETETDQNFLVILNGPQPQPQPGIRLEIKNCEGEVRQSVYWPEMRPFSLHKLPLGYLFPGLEQFCQSEPVSLSGHFSGQGVFVRPYIVTQGQYLSGYHGGDRYLWENLPSVAYRFMGQGEVNPMVALHQPDLTTTVNLLNTHGTLEEDFWVDACLYNQSGEMVAEAKHWLLARRNQLSRGDICDLLHDPARPFVGHIALRFSPDNRAEYPRRLQALLEYRTPQSTARVMAWSDSWNWSVRQRLHPLTYRAYYRVWCKTPFLSSVAITNCGIALNYDQTVSYRMRLENGSGDFLTYEGKLAPQATDFGPVQRFFPDATEFLNGQSMALVIVESRADLAIMHLSRHERSGVYAAEHFLPAPTRHAGKLHYPCGS